MSKKYKNIWATWASLGFGQVSSLNNFMPKMPKNFWASKNLTMISTVFPSSFSSLIGKASGILSNDKCVGLELSEELLDVLSSCKIPSKMESKVKTCPGNPNSILLPKLGNFFLKSNNWSIFFPTLSVPPDLKRN